jgi:hypothetical protein
VCDAAALVRARCRTPLPGRQIGSCYCGLQDGDGLPHGHGLLCLADGSFYFGALVRGQRHGLGVAVMPVTSAVEGSGGGGLPSLTNIGHPVYHTPSPHAVAAALCASSSLSAAASAALLQLKQLRVSLEDLQACAYRHWHALCCILNCNTL